MAQYRRRADDVGKIHLDGDRKVRVLEVGERSLRIDAAFRELDFDTAFRKIEELKPFPQVDFSGSLSTSDLPEAWNARMDDLLGLEVPDDARGVLQDVHWSGGSIGYFPTYALGNVISLQIWAVVRDAIPDLDTQMEAGELEGLSVWLRDNLYSLGRKLTPKETIERLTGTPAIDSQPYLAYLREKLTALPASA